MRYVVLCFTAWVLALSSAAGQGWPNHPIKLLVTQAPGSTPDIIARMVADKLGRGLGQQVMVENRVGGANVIGAGAAARAAPDGYTFLSATAATLVTNPYTFKTLPYDAQKDFAPVSMMTNNAFFVLVHPGVPAKTLPELIALARANPGTISVATDGPRNFSGMLAAWIAKLGGVTLNMVPYSAIPQGVQDTLAGRVQAVVVALPSALAHIESGKLRAVAVSSARRVPGYEHVPPVAETFPGFDFTGWFVVVAPAGTPKDVIARVNTEMGKVLKDPELRARWATMGMYTDGAGTPESTGAYIRAQYEAWGNVVRELGLRPE